MSRKVAHQAHTPPAHPTGRHGERTVRLQATRREPPDLDRFVAALIAMALEDIDKETLDTRGVAHSRPAVDP